MSSTSWRPRLTGFERLALAAWGLIAVEAAAGVDGPHLCPFRLLTGWRCPGCGMGHAVAAALRGDWGRAWAEHPLGIPLAALWTAWVAFGLLNLSRRRGFSDGFPAIEGRRAWLLLVLILAVHAARTCI